MDATDHLRASLGAAIVLGNYFGAQQSQGRSRVPGQIEEQVRAVEGALALTTRRIPALDAKGLKEFGAGGVRIYAALSKLAEGAEDAAVNIVNDLLDQTRATPRLVRHGNDPWHLHFAAPGVSAVTGWLAELATAAAMLIGSDDAARLHLCNAERCDNLFHDLTRNRTQRFCSTACQNRTKVAAFRAREEQASSAG